MKINILDLSKTISDFLFLEVENPEEKAKKLFRFKHSLTPHGFEKYIQYFFIKYNDYKVELNGKTNEFDNGIDIKGIKKENGEIKFLLVQCKKYAIRDIDENMISSFYGKIIDKVGENREKTKICFITTTKFTSKAKEFGKEKGIKTIDFYDLYKANEIYSIDKFKEDLENIEGKEEVFKSFEQNNQIMLKIYDEYVNIIEPTNQELLVFLKQIRRDYSNINQMKLGDIAGNETLILLARTRPHNFEELKKAVVKLSNEEKEKILKYGSIFTERIKYLKIEQNDL